MIDEDVFEKVKELEKLVRKYELILSHWLNIVLFADRELKN